MVVFIGMERHDQRAETKIASLNLNLNLKGCKGKENPLGTIVVNSAKQTLYSAWLALRSKIERGAYPSLFHNWGLAPINRSYLMP